MFPTLLYVAGVTLRTLLRRYKPDLDEDSQRISAMEDRNFSFSILADCFILSLLNGLIIIFGVQQVFFGVTVTVAGTIVSMFGMSSFLTESAVIREFFLTIVNIIFLGEVLDFATFSLMVSAGVIAALVVLLIYYTFRFSGAIESSVSEL